MSAIAAIESRQGGHNLAVIDLVGRGTPGEQYLQELLAIDPHRSMVIKAGGGVIDDPLELERTGRSLAYLHGLGLRPVVVNGGSPQIKAALNRAGIDSSFDPDGNRITSSAAASEIELALTGVTKALCESIEYYGGQAESIPEGVFEATLIDPDRLGMVGQVERINDTKIHRAINNEKIPVISCIGSLVVNNAGSDPTPKPVNINGDVAAVALAAQLQPLKFISLTIDGAVFDRSGNWVKSLTRDEAEQMISDGSLEGGMRLKVIEGLKLHEHGVHDAVIISPANLLLELFTDGVGTIMRADETGPIHIPPRIR